MTTETGNRFIFWHAFEAGGREFCLRGDSDGYLHCSDEWESEGNVGARVAGERYLIERMPKGIDEIMIPIEEETVALEYRLSNPRVAQLIALANKTLLPIFWELFEPQLLNRIRVPQQDAIVQEIDAIQTDADFPATFEKVIGLVPA